MSDVIAVLDVGKTNKKVFIYNKQLQVLEKNVKAFAEITDSCGLKIEQPEAVFQWFKENLKDYSNRYTITAISIATHGAMAFTNPRITSTLERFSTATTTGTSC